MSPHADEVIRTDQLTKVYPGDILAVDHLDLSVKRGEIFGLLGPNGAGKTTTAGMLTTRVIPTSGGAYVAGIDVVAHPAVAKQVIGVVPQTNTLDRAQRLREPLLPRPPVRHERQDRQGRGQRHAREVPARRSGQGSGARALGWHGPAAHGGAGDPAPSRRSSSSTSRRPASTRRAASRCGRSSARCTTRARRSSSPRTTWRKPTSSATGSRSSTTAGCSRSTRRPGSSSRSAPTRSSPSPPTATSTRSPVCWRTASTPSPAPTGSTAPCACTSRARGVLPAVVNTADHGGFTVTDLSMAEPTLEAVFINLTGKDLRE